MNELLDAALDAASASGATYVDVRVGEVTSEALSVRAETVESLDRAESLGCGVRVIAGGAWGFAATAALTAGDVRDAAVTAVEVARASASELRRPVELVDEPVHRASWSTPVEKDPLAV
jgi:TldD protein